MNTFDELVPQHIRALPGYAPGKPLKQAEAESGVACIKMASNENPLGPSPLAIEVIRQAASAVNFYPDNDATELKLALAERHNVAPENIMVTPGSTTFLDIIGRTLIEPGLNAVTSERTFIVYPISTRASGGELIRVPIKNDAYDLDALLAAINDKTRIVFIANPNNPTGTMLPPEKIERFLDCVPQHLVVVLDEAYFEFAQHFSKIRGIEYSRSLDYVRQGRRVVVLRTFSKAQGLAAARVGYGIGPAELMQNFQKVRVAFSVSSVGQAAALAALKDEKHICRTLENNTAGALWLTEHLVKMGLRVVPTWANFLYIEVGGDVPAITSSLQNEGIIIRPLTGSWGAPNAIRVSIGTPEQNQKFVDALSKVMAAAAAK
jgi:histidinol-phosphate aminotransferase